MWRYFLFPNKNIMFVCKSYCVCALSSICHSMGKVVSIEKVSIADVLSLSWKASFRYCAEEVWLCVLRVFSSSHFSTSYCFSCTFCLKSTSVAPVRSWAAHHNSWLLWKKSMHFHVMWPITLTWNLFWITPASRFWFCSHSLRYSL